MTKTANPWPARLKALRTAWGNGVPFPQGEAAARIFVTRQSWGQWERDHLRPSKTVCLLIDMLLACEQSVK